MIFARLHSSGKKMTSSFQDPRLQFLWLEVKDMQKAVNFYRETLGFPVQDDTDSFAIVHLGNTQLYLAPGTPRGTGIQIAIAVADIDALQQRLSSHQVYLSDPTDAGWARYLNLIDPDGYPLLLLQLQPDAT